MPGSILSRSTQRASRSIGYGGDAVVSAATGVARETIRKGRREIARDEAPTDRIRRPGGGRSRIQQDQPGIQAALQALVDPLTRGDPTSPLRWTCKSRAKLAAALTEQGWRVSSTTVGRLLHRLGYRLQSPRKRQEGATHPDRNAQFEHINQTADEHLTAGQPVISVDTKKKELVGNFKNGGREWQPKGTPPAVLVHDFPTDAEGKAIPYGVYDMAGKEAWVSVGWDHDTPAFAVASIRHWWHQMGCGAYPEATTLFITADAGGSNGYRLRAWKHELQQLADETGLTIEVSHFPPGTSKWNKIEHRLFCHITANWRGTPLTTYETIVDRIGNVRTATGLRVRAELDAGEYPNRRGNHVRRPITVKRTGEDQKRVQVRMRGSSRSHSSTGARATWWGAMAQCLSVRLRRSATAWLSTSGTADLRRQTAEVSRAPTIPQRVPDASVYRRLFPTRGSAAPSSTISATAPFDGRPARLRRALSLRHVPGRRPCIRVVHRRTCGDERTVGNGGYGARRRPRAHRDRPARRTPGPTIAGERLIHTER